MLVLCVFCVVFCAKKWWSYFGTILAVGTLLSIGRQARPTIASDKKRKQKGDTCIISIRDHIILPLCILTAHLIKQLK
jgi:hypothetical protein